MNTYILAIITFGNMFCATDYIQLSTSLMSIFFTTATFPHQVRLQQPVDARIKLLSFATVCCSTHLENIYSRLANTDFHTVRTVVSILAVCRNWLSLFAYVRFGFLSDEDYREYDKANSEDCVQCRHSICLHFRLLCELARRSIPLLVPHVLHTDIL